MFVTAAAVALVMLATDTQAAEPAPAVPDVTALPISLDRIRDALDRPALTIPPPAESLATFRTSVEHTAPAFESVLEGMRRDLALWSGANSVIRPPSSAPPSPTPIVRFDVLPLVSALKRKWNELKAERVRETITEELAAFCKVNDCTVLEGGASVTPEGIVVPSKPD